MTREEIRRKEIFDEREIGHEHKERYFRKHKGLQFPMKKLEALYFCPFCGKAMWKKEKMSVVRICTARHLKREPKLRKEFAAYKEGINELSNLTVCCPPCNIKKSTTRKSWRFRARHGAKYMPILRITLILYLSFLVVTQIIPLILATIF